MAISKSDEIQAYKTGQLPGSSWVTPQTTSRSSLLPIKWYRGNHPGGFIRLSIVPLESSDSWEAFNSAPAQQFYCFEKNCGPSDTSNPNGPGDGPCRAEFKVPKHLEDGKYTIQMTWFGGGNIWGVPTFGFGEYYSCTDIVVQGGETVDPSANAAPTFSGGDFATGQDSGVCKYWSSNRLGDCAFDGRSPSCPEGASIYDGCHTLEPCSNGTSMVGTPDMEGSRRGAGPAGTTGSVVFNVPTSGTAARRKVRRGVMV
ncbi:hypothetical protein HK097_010308 [Rhizophlyctis rosea]|uniref:Lytic polysaccharide monooxygenase 9 n=1 Tax=Rhizophlyctis rosea TaxID=64517 RepID=A0AAD5X2M3_9FUNG|nr:hypothetical protein HK097_010308 [Rhizophlyctis rosea]